MLRIYHNPRCSKSREALEALEARGLKPEVIEYLETPPGIEELRWLVGVLGVAPSSLVRSKEFTALELSMPSEPDEILKLIAENPSILERPIVVCEDRGCVARPADRIDWVLAGRKS